MTGRLRISGQPMGSYVRLFQFPSLPIVSHSFLLLSWSFVYISVRPIIYVPNLLFALLSYCSSLLRKPGLIRSGESYHPAPRYFFPAWRPLRRSASGLLSPTKMKSHLSPTSREPGVSVHCRPESPLYRRPKREGEEGRWEFPQRVCHTVK